MTSDTQPKSPDLATRVRDELEARPHLREMLFPFGFLVTSATVDLPTSEFPLHGNWLCIHTGNFQLHHHPDQAAYLLEDETATYFLVGHAYDPIRMIHDENEILTQLRDGRVAGNEGYTEVLNRLTGVFTTGVIEGDELQIYGDATGMQSVYYGIVDGAPYVTSHAALAGTLCGLEASAYVRSLVKYRFYHLLGRALPGDLSPYDELRRLVPNHFAQWSSGTFSVSRFYPTHPIGRTRTNSEYKESVRTAADILSNSMTLVAKKWEKPAISLTGGCDSQTTLASAAGNYADFRYFSYVSSPEEEVDANAAKTITESLGFEHERIPVSVETMEQSEDFEAISAILELSYGDIGPAKPKEVAKRIVLRESDIQVEVKSWASEVARAYYHKRFLKNRFPDRPTARYLTTLYRVFLHDRKLVRMTDEIFQDYLERYYGNGVLELIDWWDLNYWEFWSGALFGPSITGEHRLSFQIEIPYNNRLLLQALLTTPLAGRIADQPHRDMRDLTNPDVNKIGVAVTNVKHTDARARAERAYLELHTRLPF